MSEEVVIVGCGNPVRGDDGVGPYIIRKLWDLGVPPYIKLFDGGTSGIDTISHIRGAKKAVFIDACKTEDPPGTVYELPLEEIQEFPDPREGNLHSIRWFEAVAIGREILKEEFPRECIVYLINGSNFGVGSYMSEDVKESAKKVVSLLRERYMKDLRETYEVEITPDGYIIFPADFSEKYLRGYMNIVVLPKGFELHITPVQRPAHGGLLLKHFNSRGDRAALVWEILPPGKVHGKKKAVWFGEERTLVVSLI
ncbi:MAG TPA: hydrogenase maturation protease [Aigarchaeota archaeon]|nr:hydrogenase maturation protease [Aigarchaeota archaeon]